MLNWLSANLATVVICLVLAAAVGAILVNMIRNRKRGKSSCGCGCGNCPMGGVCGKSEE